MLENKEKKVKRKTLITNTSRFLPPTPNLERIWVTLFWMTISRKIFKTPCVDETVDMVDFAPIKIKCHVTGLVMPWMLSLRTLQCHFTSPFSHLFFPFPIRYSWFINCVHGYSNHAFLWLFHFLLLALNFVIWDRLSSFTLLWWFGLVPWWSWWWVWKMREKQPWQIVGDRKGLVVEGRWEKGVDE